MNLEAPDQGLKVVDAFDLDDELRTLLKPGEMVRDDHGRRHRLPRYFYEVPSHEFAVTTRLTAHFSLREFILSDLKEAPRLQGYPKYIPCAVSMLAFFLEQFRAAVGASVHVAVNGGYRSPAHKLSIDASPHMWGTAADIHRIGTVSLMTRDSVEKFNAIAASLSDDVSILPYGHAVGRSADDHIHLDIGYVIHIPRVVSEDRMEMPQESRPRFAFEERRRKERLDSLVRPSVPERVVRPAPTNVEPRVRKEEPEVRYDVFISHATEDKDDIVRPLAKALIAKGLRVWYDEFSLKLGDSVRRKIDAAVTNSRFAIVVLSHAFFAKDWPQYELDGLVTRENSGEQVILPLWHRITKNEVLARSPSLVDKLARNTSDFTVEEIATEIAEVIKGSHAVNSVEASSV